MLATSVTPLSQMDAKAMRAVYDSLAAVFGAPPAPRSYGRFELGKGIALFRSTPKPAVADKPKRPRKTAREVRGLSAAEIRRETIAAELYAITSYRRNDVTKTPAEYGSMNAKEREGFQAFGHSYTSIVNRLAVRDVRVTEMQLRKVQFTLKQEQPMPSRPIVKKRLKPRSV